MASSTEPNRGIARRDAVRDGEPQRSAASVLPSEWLVARTGAARLPPLRFRLRKRKLMAPLRLAILQAWRSLHAQRNVPHKAHNLAKQRAPRVGSRCAEPANRVINKR